MRGADVSWVQAVVDTYGPNCGLPQDHQLPHVFPDRNGHHSELRWNPTTGVAVIHHRVGRGRLERAKS